MLAAGPVVGNQVIQIIKDSAFLTIIALPELTHAASSIQSRHYVPFAAFISAVLLYWALCLVVETGVTAVGRDGGGAAMSARHGRDVREPATVGDALTVLRAVLARASARLQVLNDIELHGAARRDRLPARPVGVGQVDAAALHQLARAARLRPRLPRRRADRRQQPAAW